MDEGSRRRAERRYQIEIRRNLNRNCIVHLVHGMLGQTGFRLVNAPTFLPAYILLLSGSDLAVGLALALQALGMTLTPFLDANLIEHRGRSPWPAATTFSAPVPLPRAIPTPSCWPSC
jgi:hypothetical protein